MEKASTAVTVYSDYLCPWCYVASFRLKRLKEEFGERLSLTWRSYPLRPFVVKGLTPRRLNHAVDQAAGEEMGIHFRPWPETAHLPEASLPALEAAKYALSEGPAAFERYHALLYAAYFERGQDISRPDVLGAVAGEAGLDAGKVGLALQQGMYREEVLREFREARDQDQVISVPTVVFPQVRFDCVVPMDLYRRAARMCLEQGGAQAAPRES